MHRFDLHVIFQVIVVFADTFLSRGFHTGGIKKSRKEGLISRY